MSNIIIRNLQGGGGIPQSFKQFTDDFNRANNAAGFGPRWLYGGGYLTPAAFSVIGPNGISVNQAVFQATAVSQNTQMPVNWFPVPVMSYLANADAAKARDQFSQVKFVSTNSVSGVSTLFMGTGVLGSWSSSPQDYHHYILVAACIPAIQNVWSLLRFDNGAFTVLDSGAPNSCVQGDTLRLEARINAAGTSVELKSFINAVLVSTVNDANANRSINGSPFMGRALLQTSAAPGTAQVILDDYACGEL